MRDLTVQGKQALDLSKGVVYSGSMTLDDKSARRLTIIHGQYADAQETAYDTREDLILALRDAAAAGATQQELGDLLGVTKQRIGQLLKQDPSDG